MNRLIRKIIQRGAIGAFLGIAFSYIISIAISHAIGDGAFHPCSEGLLAKFEAELQAVIFQVALSAIYGFFMGAVTLVWESDEWPLLLQTAVHFSTLFAGTFLVGWLCYWFPHTAKSMLIAIGGFVVVYILLFAIMHFIFKKKIGELNRRK